MPHEPKEPLTFPAPADGAPVPPMAHIGPQILPDDVALAARERFNLIQGLRQEIAPELQRVQQRLTMATLLERELAGYLEREMGRSLDEYEYNPERGVLTRRAQAAEAANANPGHAG